MTKAHSEPDDNGGRCESCDDPATVGRPQTTWPVMLGGGLGLGTLWLCEKCIAKKAAALGGSESALRELRVQGRVRNPAPADPPSSPAGRSAFERTFHESLLGARQREASEGQKGRTAMAKYATRQLFGGQHASVGRVVLLACAKHDDPTKLCLRSGRIVAISGKDDRPYIQDDKTGKIDWDSPQWTFFDAESLVNPGVRGLDVVEIMMPVGSWTWPPRI